MLSNNVAEHFEEEKKVFYQLHNQDDKKHKIDQEIFDECEFIFRTNKKIWKKEFIIIIIS